MHRPWTAVSGRSLHLMTPLCMYMHVGRVPSHGCRPPSLPTFSLPLVDSALTPLHLRLIASGPRQPRAHPSTSASSLLLLVEILDGECTHNLIGRLRRLFVRLQCTHRQSKVQSAKRVYVGHTVSAGVAHCASCKSLCTVRVHLHSSGACRGAVHVVDVHWHCQHVSTLFLNRSCARSALALPPVQTPMLLYLC